MYVEDLNPARNGEIRAVAWEEVRGELPEEVDARATYGFGELPTAGQLADLLETAERIARAEDLLRGHRHGAMREKPSNKVRTEDPGPAPTRRRGTTERALPRAETVALGDEDDRWFAVRDEGGFKRGEEVAVTPSGLTSQGNKGLFLTSAGLCIFVERKAMPAEEESEKKETDARVLPVSFNAFGVRQRNWRDVVLKLSEVPFSDWPLPRPRTTLWCARFLDRRGGGPLEHHRWWVASLKLSQGDFGVQEHEHGMRAFPFFGEYDQIDAPNLVGLEVILRRCQLIEFHYEKRQRSQSGKDNTPGLTRDEAAYFSGSHRLSGEVMVSPELTTWVSQEISRDVEVTKQLRKAREESKLARKDG